MGELRRARRRLAWADGLSYTACGLAAAGVAVLVGDMPVLAMGLGAAALVAVGVSERLRGGVR